MTNPIWLVVLASAVAAFPIAIGLLTSYIKVSVVLGMLRSGIGAQQVPSGLIIMVLSLAMTAFIMAPVIKDTAQAARDGKFLDTSRPPNLSDLESLTLLTAPWRQFMQKHSGQREINTLRTLSVAGDAREAGEQNQDGALELRILIPAFVLTEIKEGFAMGFVLLLPFLAIDLIVANILAGMGMYMLSPMMISLPLKLILFVAADGWIVLTKGLVDSYL
ncbi:MAG: EscR/YscR/HrcR family type III secretion system export apparatus protein [Deltaproteobacteria bacterium]|nr:EscR/YscR/HrcR family type III secretion system export apparatus protein [Deltaproteobacteria bacterium]